jgi:hypothetical protein
LRDPVAEEAVAAVEEVQEVVDVVAGVSLQTEDDDCNITKHNPSGEIDVVVVVEAEAEVIIEGGVVDKGVTVHQEVAGTIEDMVMSMKMVPQSEGETTRILGGMRRGGINILSITMHVVSFRSTHQFEVRLFAIGVLESGDCN